MMEGKSVREVGSLYEDLLDTLPVMVLVADDDVRIQYANEAARDFLGPEAPKALYRRGGEVLHCIHSYNDAGGCGHGEACKTCVIRLSVGEALEGRKTVRSRAKLTVRGSDGGTSDIYVLVTAAPFEKGRKDLAVLTIEDFSEVMELRGIIPICSLCKKIRTGKDYWQSVEKYLESRSDARFSHSICAECLEKHYPRL
jgi:PAS domain-containing protein